MGLKSKRSKKSIFYTVLTNISRVLLALVLVVSGFVKAVDPKGTMYKLQEYADAFSIDAFSADWLLFFSIMLAAMEFLVGAFLLMGVYRRSVSVLAFVIFVIFTPFTLYVAIDNPVADCGCFGDAVGLSNEASFVKNLFLLLFSVIVFLGRKRFVLNISVKNRWMVVLFSVFYIALIEGISLSYMPVLDFRNYAVGNNLRELVRGESDVYEVVLTYEKDGEFLEFGQDSLPDDTWRFVEGHSELVAKGRKPVVGDFAVLDWETDFDISEELLADTGFVCFLVAEFLEEASVGRVDKINDLYDYCLENDILFCAATASDEDEIVLWRKRTGAEYPIYWADNMVLRTIIRANPGLVLFKDGVVAGKWSIGNMPSAEAMMSVDAIKGRSRAEVMGVRGLHFWMILFIVPLVIIVLLDILTGGRRVKELNKEPLSNTIVE